MQLDKFLSRMENADYWRTIRDSTTGKEVTLTNEQIDIIQRLQKASYPEESLDPYEVYTVYSDM